MIKELNNERNDHKPGFILISRLVGNDLRTWHHSGRITGYPEVTVVNRQFHQLSPKRRIVGVIAIFRQLRDQDYAIVIDK
jgi:hypothetical protein